MPRLLEDVFENAVQNVHQQLRDYGAHDLDERAFRKITFTYYCDWQTDDSDSVFLLKDPARSTNAIPGVSGVLAGGLPEELRAALIGMPDGVDPTELSPSGYVVDTLQTALYDAVTAQSVEEAIVTAVNRGGDTDTVGAVAGAVAGARFGAADIPDQWLATLDHTAELRALARKLTTYPQEPRR